MQKYQILAFVAVVLLAACRPELNSPRYNSGDADFTRFVAIGGGQMAGFSDNALTRSGQENSIAANLAERFSLAGGGAFRQPLVNPGNGFGVITSIVQGAQQLTFTGQQVLYNRVNCLNVSDYGIAVTPPNAADRNWIGNLGPYNNLAVPGVKSFQLYSQQLGRSGTSGNPYYARFASDTGATSGLSSTILGEAIQLNPTFFTLWIGINDVFAYGYSGGQGSTSGLGTYDITPEATFFNAMDTVINFLTGNGAQGVIGNLPDLTSLPYFTTIPYNGLILTQTEADYWNTQVQPNSGIVFHAGANGYICSSGAGIKQLGPGELVLMKVPPDSLRCFNLGTPAIALDANYVLDSAEVNMIRGKINVFNSKIGQVAMTNGIALADLNAFYKTLNPGVVFNGNTFTTTYLTGGAFSTDGIFPNGRGYALITNVFIDAINARYKSNLPHADVNSKAGTLLP